MTTTAANPLDALAAVAAQPPANREEWLQRLAAALGATFAAAGLMVPSAIRYSCGWTSTGRRSRRVGEHWAPAASADGTHEIFVTPRLADPIEVAAVLVHELAHAAVHPATGHGAEFRRAAIAVGLRGHMRATHAGEALRAVLVAKIAEIGPYPHASLVGARRPSTPPQTNRQLRAHCPTCGYTVRASRRWLDLATPICPMPAHGAMVRSDTMQRVTIEISRETIVELPVRQIETVDPRTDLSQTETESQRLAAELGIDVSNDLPAVTTRPSRELLPAPFSPAAWIMRIATALGGENVDFDDVEAAIMFEALNSVFRDATAAGATRYAGADPWRQAGGVARRTVVERPSRFELAQSWRDLIVRGFLVHPEIDGEQDQSVVYVTELGAASDPDAAADAAPVEHVAQIARRSRRFAALFDDTNADDANADDANADDNTAAATHGARFAGIDFDDAPADENGAPTTSRRFTALFA
jgi:hypothetical protein